MIDLKRFREDNSIYQSEISKVLGVAQSYVSQIENGNRPLNEEKYNTLHNHYGDIVLKYKLGISANSVHEKAIPYYDVEASAGNTSMFDPGNNLPYKEIMVPGYGDCDFAINVWGDSMSPLISNGSIIICKEWKQNYIEFGSIYLILTTENHRTVKYIFPGSSEEKLMCKSENKFHEPFEVHKQDIIRLYLIKGCIQRIT